jgi:hypothetical protein
MTSTKPAADHKHRKTSHPHGRQKLTYLFKPTMTNRTSERVKVRIQKSKKVRWLGKPNGAYSNSRRSKYLPLQRETMFNIHCWINLIMEKLHASVEEH